MILLPRVLWPLLPKSWSPECWTPRYVKDRVLSTLYWKTHPQLPWLTAEANKILESKVQPEWHVLEFGSGRSTYYFAKHCASVTTIEHDPRWMQKLKMANLANVTLIKARPEKYAEAIAEVNRETYDLILIDGRQRIECFNRSLPMLAQEGLMIFDNANRYFPSKSHGPDSLQSYNPKTPEHLRYQAAYEQLQSFNITWTTNGVTDTLILQK